MWLAAVAWQESGYEVALVDERGADVVAPAPFGGARLRELVAFVRDRAAAAGGALCAVVESTNGLVDGHLLAAGVDVYRLDPWSLPPRTGHGSVPARTLADRALADPGALTRLATESGTLTGRSAESEAAVASCAGVEGELARAGRFFERGGTAPEVALTFDDGPDPDATPRILDILRAHAVTATFFCVGMGAGGHPDLVARIVEDGHTIGNHTWSHPYLPDLSRDEVLRQVEATNRAVAAVTGRPPSLFRPPYGARTPDVLRWVAEHDMTTVLWDVDASDWARPGVASIVEETLAATAAGSVVLMHDAGGDRTQTVAALPRVIEGLRARNYRFVPVDRLTAA